ncbi:telomere length and silencing protein 1 homolog isoform X1 [Penaeus monodon]|uniref:telomere length and silencing protein 1 homolog isoform X1 n=1 Tax=Penaeus monodon TaxID=6687 RepID=UPI0018A6E1B1|nr:telomere length and silencing protein 1 homolog isoform X1 [Penaeus monodon]
MSSRQEEEVEEKPKISFKKVKGKSFRRRRDSDDEEEPGPGEEESLLAKLEESKEMRKFRRRQGGISAEGLLVGEKVEKKEGPDDDPFKTKTGGMLDLNQVKNAKKSDDAYDTGIGTSFSAETNRRDEDAEMQKYIEENLAKRKGLTSVEKQDETPRHLTLEEAALHAVPDILRVSTTKKSEEMLSNQMLSGIPEVDLGLEAKIRNIEATEEAKQKLLRERMMKKERPSEFVPKNMAVNFVQHNRFNLEEAGPAKKKEKKVQEIVEPVVGGGVKISTIAPKRPPGEKATDDFHYEKFKKQFRRH